MKRLRTFFTSLLISLLAGYAAPGWTGDDIDIYVRQASALNESVRPNILFMLDNSGSMKNAIRDENTGVPFTERRIDVLQAALLQMLNEVHNVNVGLARFAKLIKGNVPVNAPIMFPVFYIDADLTEVPGETNDSVVDVSSRLASSADDAEENLVSGNMYLDRKELKMVKLISAGDFKGIEVKQYIDAAGKNTAVEWLGNVRNVPTLGNNDRGQVKTGQSNLLLGSDQDDAAKNRGDALIALRFINLSIPVGAKIEKAEVEFVSDSAYLYEKETDKLKLTVYGAANDGAPTDKSGQDIPKDVPGYLSKSENFPSTDSSVEWTIDDAVEEGQAFKTPDISNVLQEIIKRGPQTDEAGNLIQPGWSEGNSIVLLFKSTADSPTNARGFFGRKELYDPPLLHLSWTVAETTAQVISGRGVWNNRTQEYKVENNEQAVEYGAKQTTDGMYLGYVPASAEKDTVALQAAVKAAETAYKKAQTATNTAQSKLTTADTNLQTATTNYNVAKADYDAAVATLDTQNQAFKEAELAFKAAEAAYQTALEAFNAADAEYLAAKTDYDNAKTLVDSAKEALVAAQAVVDAAKTEYNAANDAYKVATAAYTTASTNYQTANQAYSTAKSAFNTANTAYERAVSQATSAQTAYETAKTKYDIAAAKVPVPSNLATLKADMDAKKTTLDTKQAAVAPAQQTKDATQATLNEKQAALDVATAAKDNALAAKEAADAERTAKKAVVDEAMGVQNEKKTLLADAQAVLAGKKTVMDEKKAARDQKNTEMKAAKTDMTAKEKTMNSLMPKSVTVDRLKVKMDSAKAKMDTAQATKDTAEKTLEDAKTAEEAAKKALETAKKALEGGKGMVIKGTKSAVGVRFQELPIPKNATIIEAYITFTHQGNDHVDYQNPSQLDLNLNVYGEKTGNALDLASANPWLSKRIKTKASVEWTSVSPSTPGTTFRTPAKQATNPPAGTPDPAGGTTDPSTGGTTDPSTGTTDPSVQTTDLSAILQELVTQDDWKSRNSVVFMFENAMTEDFTGKLAPEIGGFRRFIGVKDDLADETKGIAVADLKGFANLPRLTVKYSAGMGAGEGEGGTVGDGDEQLVGLRFVDVDIPQGAKVLTASIEFRSDEQLAEPANLRVQVEDSDAAETFTATPKNLSSRPLAQTEVPWEITETWEKGATYTSPELAELVQTVVSRSGWCGGKGGIVFIISKRDGSPLRITKSYDDAPVLAPVLNVEYDMKSVPKGSCIQQTYSGQIAFESDDSEEKVSGAEAGDIYLTSDSLELGYKEDSRLVGFRFRDVPISKTSKVVEAKLIFTARTTSKEAANTPPTQLTIRGEKAGDSEPFTAAPGDLSGRKKTKDVPWVAPEMTSWQKNYTYTSSDIREVINEIIQHDDWNTYNNLSLFITGTGFRAANAFRAGPATAAILRIKVDGYLGEGGQGDIMTVRRQLRKIVKNIDIPPSNTPLVDGLYESAQYFRGGSVDYGKTRHDQSLYLVSHPGTYTGGILSRPKECTTTKPFEAICASEEISGVAKYTSPILTPCQSNHLVLLTDGLANQNASAENIQGMIKEFQSSCDLTYPDPDSVIEEGGTDAEEGPKTIKISKSEMCGIDLARFLHRNDNNTRVKDNQYVTTHSIGFQLGKGWTGVYKDGEGRPVVREDDIYYYATSEYGKTDEEVPPEKMATVQPGGYVEDEKATRQNGEAVKYLKEIAKEGGGNFYKADSVEELVAAFKSIVSQAMTTSTLFAAGGVSLNRFNNLYHNKEVYFSLFKPDRTPRWFGNVKKYHICQGVKSTDGIDCNVGEILDADNQKASKEGYIAESSRSYWSVMPDGKEVTLGGAGEHVPDSGTRKIFTYLDDDNARNVNLDNSKNEITIDNEELKPFLFTGDEPADDFEKVITWIRGQDVMDEDGDGDSQEPRWRVADPLHSSPVVVTYGGTVEQQQARLFVGTNDGLLRMLKADTGNPDPTIGGDEEWAFLPKDLLSKQMALMQNQAGDEHIYGLDSTPTLWTFDNNGNVQVDPEDGDFVKLYISMRRGGNNIYALDVTGSKEAPGSSPQLMWVIKGGIPETPFEKLGQSWSRPLVTQIQWKGKGTKVVLFGGGYHPSQDEGFGPTADKVGGGNAIFIADAMTGERLWWASSDDRADLKLTGMTYAIPSEMLFKDTDADGNADRLYVGDMGGQVWRVDLPMGLGAGQTAQGIQLATVSTDKPEERRRFFYPPEVIRLDDQLYAEGDGTKYDLVAIVSGTRTDPLEKVVHNQFYAFRDTQTGILTDDLSNWAGSITLDQMFDATSNVIQEDDNNSKVILELKKSRGWYINLQEKAGDDRTWIGEKGFSKVLITETGEDGADNSTKKTVFFNTYIPPTQSESVCDFSEGKKRTYVLDVFTAAAVIDVDQNKELTKNDRFVEGSGVPPEGPQKTRTENGQEPLGDGGPGKSITEDEVSIKRFFWMQK